MSQKGKQSEMPGNKKRREPTLREQSLLTTKERMTIAQKKAQNIFMQLVEVSVEADLLVDLLVHINPDIYDQITMDRGASGVCGYPLCPKEFVDTYGDQMYKIRNNQVFDISERRNYCSDVCYQASEIVKDQVSLEPLYVREDLPPKSLRVTIPCRDSLRGKYGKKVDISGGVNIPYKTHAKQKRTFTSFADVAEDGLQMCIDNMEEDVKNSENSKAESKNTDDITNRRTKKKTADENKTVETQPNERGVSNDEAKNNQTWRSSKVDSTRDEGSDSRMAVIEMEQTFREWMTFESLRVTLGDVFVKGMLEDVGARWEDFDSTEGMKLGMEAKAKYIALCRKLDEEERTEKSGPDLDVRDVSGQPTQPLPDYNQLREDAEKQQLKVVSFMSGNEQYDDQRLDSSDAETVNASLPLIDSHSQVQWRQAIVLEKLGKYMNPFLPLGQLEESKVECLVKELVLTFHFTANNIIFKPGQWNLVSLLILKMLSIRIPAIKFGLEREEFTKFQETLLSSFNLDSGYLDRFLCYVTEIRFIIRKSSNRDASITDRQTDKEKNATGHDPLTESLNNLNVTVNDVVHEKKDKIDDGCNQMDHSSSQQISTVPDDLD